MVCILVQSFLVANQSDRIIPWVNCLDRTADNAAQAAAAEQTFVVQTVSVDTESTIPETTDSCA